MNKYLKIISVCASIIIVLMVSAYLFLNRGLPQEITPADFTCLAENDGAFLEETIRFNTIYGIGLSYAHHINETASDFDLNASPPVFAKALLSLAKNGSDVSMPSSQALLQSVESVEQGITRRLDNKEITLSALVDHEVELAFVLLEDITREQLVHDTFVPKLGFFIANDLSARSIAILGEGQSNRYDYWGASKSFHGFTPVSSGIWVAHARPSGGIPCVTLQTHVNGELRQSEDTHNLIYRPVEMLRAIQLKYSMSTLNKGDIVLTGTPGGVILNVPRWKVRAAKLLAMDRFTKLNISQKKGSANRFLKVGDRIRVSGGWLGEANVTLVK